MERITTPKPPNAETAILPIVFLWFIAVMLMCSSCVAVHKTEDLLPQAGTGEILYLHCEQVENTYNDPDLLGYLVNIQFSLTKESGYAQVDFYYFQDRIWKRIHAEEDGEPYTDTFTNLRRLQSEEHVSINYNYLTPQTGRYKIVVTVDGQHSKSCQVPINTNRINL